MIKGFHSEKKKNQILLPILTESSVKSSASKKNG